MPVSILNRIGVESMNPALLGDSYDLVKRFFCFDLSALRYKVAVDPMFTGARKGRKREFFNLIGVAMDATAPPHLAHTALFVDSDTGVNRKGSMQHVLFNRLG